MILTTLKNYLWRLSGRNPSRNVRNLKFQLDKRMFLFDRGKFYWLCGGINCVAVLSRWWLMELSFYFREQLLFLRHVLSTVGSLVVRTLQLRTTFCPTSYVKFGVMMVTVIIEFASVWGIAPEVAVTTANINCDKRLSSLCNCKKVDDETHFYLGGAPSREIEFARFCYMVAVKVGIGG